MMLSAVCVVFPLVASLAHGLIHLLDPGDYADLAADQVDNELMAVYDIPPSFTPTIPVVGKYLNTEANTTDIDNQFLECHLNDTSVIVATDRSVFHLSYTEILKTGYSSDLYQASFFGVNAAINVANGSETHIRNCNISTHNGAANIFAYGDDTVVYVTDTILYSSGPVAHGLYASGNATIIGKGISHYSGGNRCSAFAGDNPAGFVYISESIAHTAGIGSALFYALGEIWATNIYGIAEQAPVLFSDGPQRSHLENVDAMAGLLAGTVMFSSMNRTDGAYLSLTNSRIETTLEDMPGMWFGNIIANVDITSSSIETTSGVLVIANASQVTQDFDHFAGIEENPYILPAEVVFNVQESTLEGNILAVHGSRVLWSLRNHTVWTGSAYPGDGDSQLGVRMDESSTWTLTRDTVLQNFTNADITLKNIHSAGFNIFYNPLFPANAWLKGGTFPLNGGGSVLPIGSQPPAAGQSSTPAGTFSSTNGTKVNDVGLLLGGGDGSGSSSGSNSGGNSSQPSGPQLSAGDLPSGGGEGGANSGS